MGCDIHVFIEAKINDQWHLVDMPHIDRWYSLFARMADVRNYGDVVPISQPRGVPEDASVPSKILLEDSDYHSHSWLSSKEWESLLEEDGYSDRELWSVVNGNISETYRDKRIQDYRVLFAFDN